MVDINDNTSYDKIKLIYNQLLNVKYDKFQSILTIYQQMKTLILLYLTLEVCLSVVYPHIGPLISHAPRTYQVNVEDSPQIRWGTIIHDYQQPLARFQELFDLLPIPQSFFHGVEWYAKNMFKYKDFVAEVDAIARLGGYPFDKIFFLNFMYEYSTFKACTGLLFRNSEGKIMHGRNLDFDMWQLLSKLIVNVEYFKNGKLLYSVDTVVGSAFALTGIRHGAFAINVNTRYADHFYNDLISIMLDNAIPTVWLLRKVLEEETTYQSALQRLKTQRIGGPVYYIISGIQKNQGAVIERDTDKTHAIYQLTDETWFLVQTNYDRNLPDPHQDQRRTPVQNKLKQRGNKNFNEKNLMEQIMSVYPTLNIQTIMTTIMVPSTSYHNTTVWYGYNPQQFSLTKQ